MATVTGKVINVESTTVGSTKKYTVYIVSLDDGHRYETFDKSLSIGNTITFDWELKFGKRQIVKGSIIKGGAAGAGSAAGSARSTGGGKVFPIPRDHGDRAIIRQNALAHATRVVLEADTSWPEEGSPKPSNEEVAATIIEIAKLFETYTSGELDAFEAMAAEAEGE